MFVALADEFRNNLGIEIEDGDFIIRDPIAHCAESDRFVFVYSKMSPSVDLNVYSGIFHELSFSIEIISPDGSYEPISTQERDIAASYIPPDFRHKVIRLVTSAYVRFVRTYRPAVIYRVTKAPDARDKRLQKHDILTAALEKEGYRVTQTGRDRHRRRF